MLNFRNILKMENFAERSGKRQKLTRRALVDFLSTLSAQNDRLDVSYHMKYVLKASTQYIRCYNTIFEPS